MNADFIDVPTHAALAASAAGQAASAPAAMATSLPEPLRAAWVQGAELAQNTLGSLLHWLSGSLSQAGERSAQAIWALRQAGEGGDEGWPAAVWNVAAQWFGDAAVRDMLLLLVLLMLAWWRIRQHRARPAAVRRRTAGSSPRSGAGASAAMRSGKSARNIGASAALGASAAGLVAGAWADDDDAHWLGGEATPGADFSSFDASHHSPGCAINPATGLPMVGDSCAGVDVAGNPYGMDLHAHDHSHDSDAFSRHGSDAFSDFGSHWDSFSSHDTGSSWDSGMSSSSSPWD